MCPEIRLNRPQGFALPAAMFVLVVVAAIVVAMMRLSGSQIAGESLNLLSTRAYWAAQSGLEWGAHRVTSAPGGCFGNTTLTIGSFAVAVRCNVTGYAEASATNNVFRYRLDAEAVTSGMTVDNPDYVYRAVQATILIRN